MRKLFAAGFLLAFSACPLWAQVGAASSGPGGLDLQIGGMSGSAASLNAAVQLNGGFGGEAFLGVAIAKYLSIGVATGFDSYAYLNNSAPFDQGLEAGGLTPAQIAQLSVNTAGNFNYVPFMGELKWVLERDSIRPYVLLGAGVAHNTSTEDITVSNNGATLIATGTASETDFLLAPGAGVQCQLGEDLDLFFQFRIDIDFTSNNNTDTGRFTFTANGATYSTTAPTNLTGDSPTFFIPFGAGMDFNL